MSSACWQVSMAQYGFDLPCFKKLENLQMSFGAALYLILYHSIASPILTEIATYSDSIQEMWGQSFTNSLVVMMKTKVLQSAKEHFRIFFSNSAIPKQSKARRIGLAPRESILDG